MTIGRLLVPVLLCALAACNERRRASSSQADSTPSAAAVAIAPQHPDPVPAPGDTLIEQDLKIAGIRYRLSTDSVRRALGEPIARDSSTWRYLDLEVYFVGVLVEQVELTGPTRSTLRGLHVGDAAARIEQLYGRSQAAGSYYYEFSNNTDPSDLGMIVQVENDRVTRIILGVVADLD